MKPFRFRLQRVMDAKESEKRLRERDLGQAVQAMREEEKKLAALLVEMDEHLRRQRELIRGTIQAGDLVLANRWQRKLSARILRQRQQVRDRGKEVEEARLRLIEASREEKVLEKLKARRLEEHRQQVLHEMQGILDDAGARRWVKTGRSNRIVEGEIHPE
ncbi:MAG TPA: flagellar export protein FliJ [Bacteroidetes bacterium]|nr:flagellar export protein FliJ [Bacteroidota bacterium]